MPCQAPPQVCSTSPEVSFGEKNITPAQSGCCKACSRAPRCSRTGPCCRLGIVSFRACKPSLHMGPGHATVVQDGRPHKDCVQRGASLAQAGTICLPVAPRRKLLRASEHWTTDSLERRPPSLPSPAFTAYSAAESATYMKTAPRVLHFHGTMQSEKAECCSSYFRSCNESAK